MKPMFSYFGSKYRLARRYPAPIGIKRVVEPFAGSACYSLFYNVAHVDLFDVNPIICGIWDYLIKASSAEILALPIEFDCVKDLNISQEARWLLGFWVGKGRTTPCQTFTKWGRQWKGNDCKVWGFAARNRISQQVNQIRHWTITNASYETIDFRKYGDDTLWFVDPPYTTKGKLYRTAPLDYLSLSLFCHLAPGRVIACEDDSADWLPFKPLATVRGVKKRSIETVWISP